LGERKQRRQDKRQNPNQTAFHKCSFATNEDAANKTSASFAENQLEQLGFRWKKRLT
jgi:hypothetical protein